MSFETLSTSNGIFGTSGSGVTQAVNCHCNLIKMATSASRYVCDPVNRTVGKGISLITPGSRPLGTLCLIIVKTPTGRSLSPSSHHFPCRMGIGWR